MIGENRQAEKAEVSYQTVINGTNYKVILETADRAKMTYEELIRKKILTESEGLPSDDCA